MDFKLSEHAKKRCLKRKIKIEWITLALNHFVKSYNDSENDSLVHVLYPVAEKRNKVIHVIYNETVEPVNIVTAFFENEVIQS